MTENQNLVAKNVDWITLLIYFALVIIGWMNIYSSSYFSMENIATKQLMYIGIAVPIIFLILYIDAKLYEKYASIVYVIALVLLVGLFFFGKTTKGQRAWYAIAGFTFQVSEFAKIATALAIAKYLSISQVNLKNTKNQVQVLIILFLPMLLIIAQPDPGSFLIYCFFLLVLYREGLPNGYMVVCSSVIVLFVLSLIFKPIYVIIFSAIVIILLQVQMKLKFNFINTVRSILIIGGITLYVFSVKLAYDGLLKQHHRDRFDVILGKTTDIKGVGYNVNQSKIAIGSGRWFGKGYLEGTQTKGGFVPEQHTDYIFTTVGEEWGFFGSIVVIGLYVGLLLRLVFLSERQKTKFSRVYGYCVTIILFAHFFINLSMVVGIFPTIGVPLPFLSFGGSSFTAFTILLFLFIKMDINRRNEW